VDGGGGGGASTSGGDGGGSGGGGGSGSGGGNNSSGGGGGSAGNNSSGGGGDGASETAIDDAAGECAALVVWLDPEVISMATPNDRQGCLMRRRAAARSAGCFRLRVGGRGRWIGLRHWSVLLAQAPGEDEGASDLMSDIHVEERAGNHRSAQFPRLVELRFT
jgi:hypothetical protein